MYWPIQPKTLKKREENSEDIAKREPRFYVQRTLTTSSTRSQPRGAARVPLPRQCIPVVNKALAKSHARKSSGRGASLPNAAAETTPVQDGKSDTNDNFFLQLDCRPNTCVHEKDKPCPNEVCLLEPTQEKKSSSLTQNFTLTRPSSLISKLEDVVKASTSGADSKNKSTSKGKSKSQSDDKAAPPSSKQSADKSSKRPSDSAAAKVPGKMSASSSTRASDNASGAGSPSKTPPKPLDPARSKKPTGTGARRFSGNTAPKLAAVPPPKKGVAPRQKRSLHRRPPVRVRAKLAQQRPVPRIDGGKRRPSDPKDSGKVTDKGGAKQTQTVSEKAAANVPDRGQRDDKTPTDKTSDRGSEKSSSGGKIPNVGDGCVPNPPTKSGSMASGTSTSSSRGIITKIIYWPNITTYARNILVTSLALAVFVILFSLLFPDAFNRIVTLLLRTDASTISRRIQSHLLHAPYLEVALKTGERTVTQEPRNRISGGGHDKATTVRQRATLGPSRDQKKIGLAAVRQSFSWLLLLVLVQPQRCPVMPSRHHRRQSQKGASRKVPRDGSKICNKPSEGRLVTAVPRQEISPASEVTPGADDHEPGRAPQSLASVSPLSLASRAESLSISSRKSTNNAKKGSAEAVKVGFAQSGTAKHNAVFLVADFDHDADRTKGSKCHFSVPSGNDGNKTPLHQARHRAPTPGGTPVLLRQLDMVQQEQATSFRSKAGQVHNQFYT
ncbi:hypothetical protein MRX96_039656 [Rhipicephalus microplus]